MAAPSRVNWSKTEAGATDITVDTSAVPEGGWMVLALVIGGNVEVTSPPSGWTNPLANPSQVLGSRRMALAYKVKSGDTSAKFTVASAVGKVAFLMWGTGSAPVADWDTGLIGVRNAANAVSGQSVQAGDSFTSVAPSVNVGVADSLILSVLVEATSAAGTFTLTSGATEWFNSPEGATFIESGIGAFATPAIGATSNVVATSTATQANNGAGVQIVIAPGDTPPPPTPDPGFNSVGQVLATPGATWAHRGGSLNWPEMSEYAYEQSALAGYGVLEFSAQRTIDGVWFGLHDASLDRTSETTGLPNVNTMTWAEVQAQANMLNSAGTPRVYYKLIDFLEKFVPTHVVVIDNKTAKDQPEFFDILDANGGASKIIVKAFGVGTGGGASTLSAQRGYESWGYFYEADFTSGDLATYQGNWTILGLNINASALAWEAVTGYGKPVAAHIAQNAGMYDTAIANGARMVQCSGVSSIPAVSRISPEDQPWDSARIGAALAASVHVGDQQVWP